MNTRMVSVAALLALGVGVSFWIRKTLRDEATADTRGVTQSSKVVGGTPLITSPIRNPAFVAPASTLTLLNDANKVDVSMLLPQSLQIQSPRIDYLQPFGSLTAARAAFNAPLQTVASNYRPSSYAII